MTLLYQGRPAGWWSGLATCWKHKLLDLTPSLLTFRLPFHKIPRWIVGTYLSLQRILANLPVGSGGCWLYNTLEDQCLTLAKAAAVWSWSMLVWVLVNTPQEVLFLGDFLSVIYGDTKY